MDVNLSTQGKPYSTLKEQSEHVEFLNDNGLESEPMSYETISYATGKVKRSAIESKRKKIAAQRAVLAKKPMAKKVLVKKPVGIKADPTSSASKKGLSLGAKIGIGFGSLLLVGGIAYFAIKRKK